MNELILKYNVDRNGNPYCTTDPKSTGTMQILLDKAFKVKQTKSGAKCEQLAHRRKLLKFIMKVATDDQIKQLHDWMKDNAGVWLQELEKLLPEKVVMK